MINSSVPPFMISSWEIKGEVNFTPLRLTLLIYLFPGALFFALKVNSIRQGGKGFMN